MPRPMRPRGTRTPEQAKENRARIAQARNAAIRRLIGMHPEDWHRLHDEENLARGITPMHAGRLVGHSQPDEDYGLREFQEALLETPQDEDFPEGWEEAAWAQADEAVATTDAAKQAFDLCSNCNIGEHIACVLPCGCTSSRHEADDVKTQTPSYEGTDMFWGLRSSGDV